MPGSHKSKASLSLVWIGERDAPGSRFKGCAYRVEFRGITWALPTLLVYRYEITPIKWQKYRLPHGVAFVYAWSSFALEWRAVKRWPFYRSNRVLANRELNEARLLIRCRESSSESLNGCSDFSCDKVLRVTLQQRIHHSNIPQHWPSRY